MSDNIYLTRMSRAIAEVYFKGFCFDNAIFLDGQPIPQFKYSDEWLDDYLTRKRNCVHLAIMRFDEPVGEILFKRIDHVAGTAVFSVLYADAIKKNQRSIHVLEKVGFQLVNEDERFIYYKIENQQW